MLDDVSRLLLPQIDKVLDELEEILAPDELSEDIDVGLRLDCLFELDHQRMRQKRHDTAFVAELNKIYAIIRLSSPDSL